MNIPNCPYCHSELSIHNKISRSSEQYYYCNSCKAKSKLHSKPSKFNVSVSLLSDTQLTIELTSGYIIFYYVEKKEISYYSGSLNKLNHIVFHHELDISSIEAIEKELKLLLTFG